MMEEIVCQIDGQKIGSESNSRFSLDILQMLLKRRFIEKENGKFK